MSFAIRSKTAEKSRTDFCFKLKKMEVIKIMSECTVLTLNEKLGNEDLHLVDVREYAEFAGGRIAGAKLVPLGEIEKRNAELDRYETDLCYVPDGKPFGAGAKKITIVSVLKMS